MYCADPPSLQMRPHSGGVPVARAGAGAEALADAMDEAGGHQAPGGSDCVAGVPSWSLESTPSRHSKTIPLLIKYMLQHLRLELEDGKQQKNYFRTT